MKLMGGLDDLAHRRALKRWARIADAATELDPFSLRTLRGQARMLRASLDRVISIADRGIDSDHGRLTADKAVDWAWRPGLWDSSEPTPALVCPQAGAQLGYDLKVFHDCTDPALIIRQDMSPPEPPRVAVDVFDFDGSFLSLVLDVPAEYLAGLGRHHIIGIDMQARMERPIEILSRLNIRHGPNTEQIVQEMAHHSGNIFGLAFDLAYCEMNEKRVAGAWIDIIIDKPSMNRIVIEDLLITRRVRAEM